MSDRTTLLGLAFGAIVLTTAALGFFAYEFARDDAGGSYPARIDDVTETNSGAANAPNEEHAR